MKPHVTGFVKRYYLHASAKSSIRRTTPLTYLVSCVGEPEDEIAESAHEMRFDFDVDLSVVKIGFLGIAAGLVAFS